jgi:tRNA A64-2'-O-ribosylphosphate transferase
MNRFLFPDQLQSHDLYTPPQVISQSEHAQITALLPTFVASLRALNMSADVFKTHISKPLRPIWITPESHLSPTDVVFEDFHPIICCTVSRRVSGGEVSEGGYIQGAGDDTENWAHGLTPSIFWAHRESLLSTSENDLPDLIGTYVQASAETRTGSGDLMRCVKPTSCLFVTSISAIEAKDMGTDIYTITLLPKVTEQSAWRISKTRLDVGLGPHKLGSRNIRMALPTIVDFAGNLLLSRSDSEKHSQKDKHIVIACESGKDLSIGVALALLCLFFDEQGVLRDERTNMAKIDKVFIRRRLGWISTSMPDANPSRATLQSVNSFLMSPH